MMNTDHDWEAWGQKDPYFGVLTDEKYRSKNITETAKLDFFDSGEAHVNHVLSICRKHFDANFIPERALDFGCGVGRLVVPLAAIASEVIGLDISEAMLQEARKNCTERKIQNVRFLKSDDNLSALDGKSDDNLSALDGKFDFIHSCIVLQHIPIARGNRIILNLIEHLSEGGIAAIHITYAKSRYNGKTKLLRTAWIRAFLQSTYRFFRHYWKTFSRYGEASMQMNTYNLNEVLFLVQSAGITHSVSEFTDHGGELGVLLYFQKTSTDFKLESNS